MWIWKTFTSCRHFSKWSSESLLVFGELVCTKYRIYFVSSVNVYLAINPIAVGSVNENGNKRKTIEELHIWKLLIMCAQNMSVISTIQADCGDDRAVGEFYIFRLKSIDNGKTLCVMHWMPKYQVPKWKCECELENPGIQRNRNKSNDKTKTYKREIYSMHCHMHHYHHQLIGMWVWDDIQVLWQWWSCV